MTMLPREIETLRSFFQSNSESRVVHALLRYPNTTAYCDNWVKPRVAAIAWKDHLVLAGDANMDGWTKFVASVDFHGFIQCPEDFLPGLRRIAPDLAVWPRVRFVLHESPREVPYPRNARIRKVGLSDAPALEQIGQSWVWNYWEDAEDFCRTATAYVAVVETIAISVVSIFVEYENHADLAVATHPSFRRKGLATAAAHALCAELVAQGKVPVWSTSPDNIASSTIPRKLGFTEIPANPVYVMNHEIPPVE